MLDVDSLALEAMFEEMRGADPVFRPSKLWDWLIEKNLEQLAREGLEGFKSTINQNYYNWIPHTIGDNQVRNLIRYWSENPSLAAFQAVCDGPVRIEHLMEPSPLADPMRRSLYALFVALLWHFAAQHDPYNILGRLAEPKVGNPVRVRLGDRLISQDLANSAREFTTILDCLPGPSREGPMRVAELGAGYGRLAYVFLRCRPCQYWIFDIPPALYIAQWYLSRVLPEKRIFRFRHFDTFATVESEAAAADLCFFTPNQLPLIPAGCVDAFVSIASLQEMQPEAIGTYLRLMGEKTRHLVYLKQWIRSVNPADQLIIPKYAYRLGRHWSVALDRTDPIQNLFFETAFRRGTTPMRLLRTWRRQLGSRLSMATGDARVALIRRTRRSPGRS